MEFYFFSILKVALKGFFLKISLRFIHFWSMEKHVKVYSGCKGIEANELDCSLQVNEFEFQSPCYIQLRTNDLGKCTNPLFNPLTID